MNRKNYNSSNNTIYDYDTKIYTETKKNNNYKGLFDNYFNNYYYDLCDYPLNVLNYVCSCSNCSK